MDPAKIPQMDDTDAMSISSEASSSPSSGDEFGGLRARAPRARKRARTAPTPIPKVTKPKPQNEPGAWERHTKGIGSKLLRKMGFTGRLGAHSDGIVEPVVFKPRDNPSAGLGVDAGRAAPAPANPRAAPPPSARELVTVTKSLCDKASADVRAAKAEAAHAATATAATQDELARVDVQLNTLRPRHEHLAQLSAEVRKLAKLDSSDAHALARALQNDCPALRAECTELKLDARGVVCELAAPTLRIAFRAALRGSARDAHAAAALLAAARTALGTRGTASYIRLCSRAVLREARVAGVGSAGDVGAIRALTAVRDVLHEDVLAAFTLEVLTPALTAQLTSNRAAPHTVVHPWLPVVGTRVVAPLWPALSGRIESLAETWKPTPGKDQIAEEIALWNGVARKRDLQDIIAPIVTPKIAGALAALPPDKRANESNRFVSRWLQACGARPLAKAIAESIWSDVERLRDIAFMDTVVDLESPPTVIYRAWCRTCEPLMKHLRGALAAMLFILAAERKTRKNLELRNALRAANVRVLANNGYTKRGAQLARTNHQRGDVTARRETVRDAVSAHLERSGLLLIPDGRDRDGRERFRVGNTRFIVDGKRQVVLHVAGDTLTPVGVDRIVELARASTS